MCGERSYYLGPDADQPHRYIWQCICGVGSEKTSATSSAARAAVERHQQEVGDRNASPKP